MGDSGVQYRRESAGAMVLGGTAGVDADSDGFPKDGTRRKRRRGGNQEPGVSREGVQWRVPGTYGRCVWAPHRALLTVVREGFVPG